MKFCTRVIFHWMGPIDGLEPIYAAVLSSEHVSDSLYVEGMDDDEWFGPAEHFLNESRILETSQEGDFFTVLLAGDLQFWSRTDHEGTPDGGTKITVEWSSVHKCSLDERVSIHANYGLRGDPHELRNPDTSLC